jgi:cellobiose-specific phosphotransferase system component IIC
MDWRAILLAVVGLIAPFLYVEITGWDAGFPITEGNFTQLLQWVFGWIFTLLGLGAAGGAGYRLWLQRKIKKASGELVGIGKLFVREK